MTPTPQSQDISSAGPLTVRKPAGWLRWTLTRLRNRPDSEHEMTFNRVMFTFLILGYVLFFVEKGSETANIVADNATYILIAYVLAALAIFAHILVYPNASPARRIAAIGVDITAVTFLVSAGNAELACIYPIYLWTIFGNGFRFGVQYLIVAAGASLIGFGATIYFNKFWHDHLSLSLGLWVALIVLPAYAAVLIKKLSKALQEAEAANRAKSAFLASMSHELRTPLNSIIGLTEILEKTRLDEDQHDMAVTIGQSGKVLLGLINSVLDHSRLEIGKMPANAAQIDLFEAVNQVSMMLRVQASAKDIGFEVYIDPAVPRFVMANRSHLGEVLTNLIGNAIKFTAQGQVGVKLLTAAIAAESRTVRFEISDTGIGIDPASHAHIFESFTQADTSIIDRFGGTGLGLSITRQLVELYGGRIGLESEPGVGSTFWFEFDFAEIPAETERLRQEFRLEATRQLICLSDDREIEAVLGRYAANLMIASSLDDLKNLKASAEKAIYIFDLSSVNLDAANAFIAKHNLRADDCIAVLDFANASPASGFITSVKCPPASEDIRRAIEIAMCSGANALSASDASLRTASGRKYRILVAEDNKTNQKVIARILGNAGYMAAFANNGQEALDMLNDNEYDLVFMDINMPVLNGIEAAKLYQFSVTGRIPVPIFALTADVTAETRAKCLDAGMQDCVTKPIEASKLINLIEETLEHKNIPAAIHADEAVDAADAVAVSRTSEASETDAVDIQAIRDLVALGGKDFLREIVDQFVIDASGVLAKIAHAVAEENNIQFREEAHALRSCSANVGAQNIYKLCLTWRELDPVEMARKGEEFVRMLEEEFGKAREALEQIMVEMDEEGSSRSAWQMSQPDDVTWMSKKAS